MKETNDRTDTFCHIFFTGEKQIGKSTLLRKVLVRAAVEYGGIRTVSRLDVCGRKNVYVVDAAEAEPQLPECRLAGIFAEHKVVQKNLGVFDGYGIKLLDDALKSGCRCLVIDEIGNLEADAAEYSDYVRKLLDRTDIRVFGVLQKACISNLADAIRRHPNTKLIEIDKTNRNCLLEHIAGLLQ